MPQWPIWQSGGCCPGATTRSTDTATSLFVRPPTEPTTPVTPTSTDSGRPSTTSFATGPVMMFCALSEISTVIVAWHPGPSSSTSTGPGGVAAMNPITFAMVPEVPLKKMPKVAPNRKPAAGGAYAVITCMRVCSEAGAAGLDRLTENCGTTPPATVVSVSGAPTTDSCGCNRFAKRSTRSSATHRVAPSAGWSAVRAVEGPAT
mmetsp:Transcript_4059/g.12902  ORF Transcript_4059/g.12902 Transcript_4059/m.12902 type:complete len:204 (-) Transcript_4059:481-1092(-)